MSAFKGTPGPWEVVNGTDVFTRLGGRNGSGVAASKTDGWHIADCDMGPSFTEEGQADIPPAEKRANARLIAAAPESHEANKLSLTVLCAIRAAGVLSHDTNILRDLDSAIGANRAAIAKATGEQL